MLLKEVCKISANNYQKKDNWSYFNYLDTGSLTKNNIDGFQKFNSTKELPSRAKQKVEKDTILYSSVRPNQEHYGYIDKDYDNLLVSTGFIILKPTQSKVNPKYLYYYITQKRITDLLQGIAQNSTSSYPSITKDDLLDLEIDLPPRPIQDKIAEILSNIDNQIERNNAMVKTLQDLASTTYSRWFNQFEFPNEDGLPYKSNNGEFVYNEDLKRNIPVGWEVKELLDLIEWKSSSQPPKSDFIDEYKKGYIRFIQNRDYDTDNHITYVPLTQNTKTCTKYDIMIDKYGDAGKIRYGLEGAFNVALAKIEPKCVNQQEFIRKYLEQECIYAYLNNACIASTRASLNELVFKGLKIVVPTNEILKDFEIIMKNIVNQILDIVNNTNKLNNLKSKLIPLLINGQLEV